MYSLIDRTKELLDRLNEGDTETGMVAELKGNLKYISAEIEESYKY